MIKILLEQLQGQHVCLFTDNALELYKNLGFTKGETCRELVVGRWLVTSTSV